MHGIWHVGLPGEEIPHGFIIRQIRVAILLVKGVVKDALPLRASALTFATMLSVVPFLAIMFFTIQTFNLGEGIGELLAPDSSNVDSDAPLTNEQKNQQLWEQFIGIMFQGIAQNGENPTDENLINPVETLVKYAEQGANSKTITLAGVIFVLTTVLGLMMNIESSFNTIWGVNSKKSWYRMFSDYIMILLFLPFLVAGVLGVTALLESTLMVERLGPFSFGVRSIQYMIIWLAFTALYFFTPDARVKLRYALLAGIVAGTLWSLLSLAYVKFQFGLPRYNLVYSTLAQVPVLLMWIYSSWLVLLFGAELAFAYQNEKTFAMERLSEGASYAYREALGFWTMIELGKRFDAGQPSLSAEAAAKQWNVPLRLLNDTLSQLQDARLVVRSATNPPTYQPGRSLDRITVEEVSACFREAGRDPSPLRQNPAFSALLAKLAPQPDEEKRLTVRDLIGEPPLES